MADGTGVERGSVAEGGEPRFRSIFEAAPFGIHLYRLEGGRLIFAGANPAADRILGVSNAAFVGKVIEEAFPPLAATEVPARYLAAARDGVRWSTEQVAYQHGAIVGAYEVHAFQTRPGEMAAAFVDITERRRAADALSREKEHLAVTLRSIGDAVVVTDAAGRVTLMNPVAEALTGWPAAEAAGRPLAEVFRIFSEETGLPSEDPVARVLREGAVVGLANHTQLRARGGALLPIADSGAPIRGADGALAGVVLVFRDQTADREAERRLRESEARYRAVVQAVPVVQWTTDRDGRFTLSEGLGLANLGLQPGQVVGLLAEEVYHDNPGILADHRRALAGEIFRSENRIGDSIFEARWAPLRDEAGDVVGTAGVAVDVTDLRALQEQVQRAQRLESLGRLAGGVAHDFKNLLAVVLASAEALREDTALGRPARLEDLEQILEAGLRAHDLVRQLLAVARKQVIRPAPTDLAGVVRGAEKLLRRALGAGIELSLSAEEPLWPVLCDPDQMVQVILNLALNARDAMPGGGHLTLELRNVLAPPTDAAGEAVRLRVRDTGAGLSPEARAHLFEPFFTTKEPGKGSGLGLAMVHGLVTQFGGRIQVESAPGQGTAFELTFPRFPETGGSRVSLDSP